MRKGYAVRFRFRWGGRYDVVVLWGRPSGRRVCCRPRRAAARAVQFGEPNGELPCTARRMAASSGSFCGWLTIRSQFRGGSTGQSDRTLRASESRDRRRHRLHQGQSSARSTRFARSAFRSTQQHTHQEVLVGLHGKRLEAALVQVPGAGGMIVSVPAHGVRVRQPADKGGQLSVSTPVEHQVPVVGHQTAGQHSHGVAQMSLDQDPLDRADELLAQLAGGLGFELPQAGQSAKRCQADFPQDSPKGNGGEPRYRAK